MVLQNWNILTNIQDSIKILHVLYQIMQNFRLRRYLCTLIYCLEDSGVDLFAYEVVNYGKILLLYRFTVDISVLARHFVIHTFPVHTLNQEI